MSYTWSYNESEIDISELRDLYKKVLFEDKTPEILTTMFQNSKYKCFLLENNKIIGAGRALGDGVDVSYIDDVAIHPDYQGKGLGKMVIEKLVEMLKSHKKILLYSIPGKEGFYDKLGFKKMKTAMGLFENEEQRIIDGFLENS